MLLLPSPAMERKREEKKRKGWRRREGSRRWFSDGGKVNGAGQWSRQVGGDAGLVMFFRVVGRPE
ncbi:hypothetical protein HAX54_007912, partial [Datura stramonium]|nr:hypothetical protein [Datura stramonium]